MRPTVLIVDDHAEFRASASALLESEGFDVIGEAADGEAAISESERLRPEIVLVDIQLPGLDGFAVAESIQRDGGTPPAILAFSGLPREQTARARALGCAAVCAKPIDGERFVAAVRRLCPPAPEETR